MGAEDEMLRQCLIYGGIFLAGLPFYILQYEFQCLFATADKHKLGMYVTIIAGCTNIVLDALFVAVFPWGVAGAAVATVISQIAGGNHSACVFPAKKRQSSAPYKMFFRRNGAAENVHKRLVRADEQHFGVGSGHAV